MFVNNTRFDNRFSIPKAVNILIRQNQSKLNAIHIIIDVILSAASCAASYFAFRCIFQEDILLEFSYDYKIIIPTTMAIAALQVYCNKSFDLYRSYRTSRFVFEMTNLIKAGLTVFIFLVTAAVITSHLFLFQISIMFYFFFYTASSGIYRFMLRKMLRFMRSKGYNKKTIVLIGANNCTENFIKKILHSPDLGYEIAGYFDHAPRPQIHLKYLGSFKDLTKCYKAFPPDEAIIMLSDKNQTSLSHIIAICENWGVKFSIIPNMFASFSSRIYISSFDGIPVMGMRKVPLEKPANKLIKRFLDITLSLIMLVILSPVMLVTALIIKMTSPGSIIFRQERVGIGSKPFIMYKFRSMRVETEGDLSMTEKNDDRCTPFGRFIRKFSIDELPQLFNVIKGEMSLVGPRPEIPFYVDRFRKSVPLYMVKHYVKPGITGWAQVNDLRGGDTSIPERIKYDIYYIENWSVLFDFKILFRTLFKAVFSKNAR